MGIRYLEYFIRTKVPDGFVPVNIRNAIRTYKTVHNTPPIIVIDFMALFEPVCRMDVWGLLCGGRYEYARQTVDRFLQRLRALGATLVFFDDGPFQHFKQRTKASRHNEKYAEHIAIMKMVDSRAPIDKISGQKKYEVPNNMQYPLKLMAQKHGKFRVSFHNECDLEVVAYANSVGAMAIITDDSDFLIFEGSWHYWSAKSFDFEMLSTKEYNRDALLTCLGLSRAEMPLFATLGGNDFIPYDEVKSFHSGWGNKLDKFWPLADFVRAPHEDLVLEVFGEQANLPDLRNRFQEGLDFYQKQIEIEAASNIEDSVAEYLKKEGKSWMYVIWMNATIFNKYYFIDLRDGSVSAQYPSLVSQLIRRHAAVILFHKPDLGDNPSIRMCLKASHEEGFGEQSFSLQFPPDALTPPCIFDLLSEDPVVRAELFDTKLKLYCWMISDTLDHAKVQSLPKKLLPTVLTLYFLMEHRTLELFEADLLLQIAHEVAFEKYNPFKVKYPPRFYRRPFRVAFLYNAILRQTLLALEMLGLDKEFPPYPQFDGTRFHVLYKTWQSGEGELDEELQSARIYADL